LTSSNVVGFKNEEGVRYAGQHIIADLWGSTPESHTDDKFIERVLTAAAKDAGAVVLFSHFHTFGEGQGITGVLVLAESHISIHTWPEESFIAIDIFMCGKAQPKVAFQDIREAFKSERVIVGNHKRGVV